jgi:DNA-binding response OmpR family regulator
MKKILVVDDEVAILTVVKLILSQYNFQVETVSKWEHLSAVIRSFTPDLIILDVTLPGCDGRDVCCQLKSAEDTAHIPIILFSADNNSIRSLKGCKPDAVIEKPFDSAELVSVIQRNLN